MKKKDKIQKLAEVQLSIIEQSAQEAESIGYMSRILIQGCWPHAEKEDTVYVRQDGHYRVTLMNPAGLPYGSYPRLIMAWVITEAKLTGSPELHLGRSLREFMRRLDIECTGGKNGTITRLKEQVERVFTTMIRVDQIGIDRQKEVAHKTIDIFPVSCHFELWWCLKIDSADSLWESKLTLSPNFFNEITEHGYPLDLRVIQALRHSPLALDLYFFLSHRIYSVNRNQKPARLPWVALQKQVGAGYPETQRGRLDFKSKAKHYFTQIILLWPGLNLREYPDGKGIILSPSSIPISKV